MTALVRNPTLLGSILALGAAISYGSSQYLQKVIVTSYAPPLIGATFALFFGMVILATAVHRHIPTDLKSPRKSLVLMALAGLSSSTGVLFSYLAVSRADLVIVAPVSGVTPLVSLVLTHIFLQRLEKLTWRMVLGALMITGGVMLITITTLL